jgi:hypothetical protein
MNTHVKAVDRETIYLFPPSVQDWLPERHLARFVVDVVSKLDLRELKMPYTGVGSEAFNAIWRGSLCIPWMPRQMNDWPMQLQSKCSKFDR